MSTLQVPGSASRKDSSGVPVAGGGAMGVSAGVIAERRSRGDARGGGIELRRDGHGRRSDAPQTQSSRMGWLFDMISNAGQAADHEFSKESAQWIQSRVASNDVSSRRDRGARQAKLLQRAS